MGKTEIKDGASVNATSDAAGREGELDAERSGTGTGGDRPARRAKPGGGSPLQLYKPNQGAAVRWGSAVGASLIAVSAASFVFEQLGRIRDLPLSVRYLIPVGLLVMLAVLIFRLVGQSRSVVDFMIATELELKKVNWSTRREVLGWTRVVIATVLMLGLILFVVDLLFIFVFESIGVLRVGMLAELFGRGGEG